MPAVAHLVRDDGSVVGGVARRDEEWVLVLGGKVMAATDSAAMSIAMLRHARSTLARDDAPLALRIAPVLDAAATQEAALAGLELEPYLAALEAERVERATERDATRQ